LPYRPDVEYIGEISDGEKPAFFSGAIALLAPIDWPEPFGLVTIEAMACGTPVIAFNRGAVPEIVEHGLTGFVVEDETSAVAAVHKVDRLSRKKIRSRFEDRFTARRMAEDYVAVYRGLIDAAERWPRLVARPKTARGRLGLTQPQVDFKAASGRVSGSSSQTNTKPQTAMNARP
jgi:hypothetical protein